MSTVHVVPLHDLVEHSVPGGVPSETVEAAGTDAWLSIESPGPEVWCICNPTLEFVPNGNGVEGWVWTHNSLDGREATE